MADRPISGLVAAEQITAPDLFVLEQNGTAKKLTGQILLNWLTAAADGHGGISGISKLSTSGLVDTYRIALADTTTFDFAVTNGKGINRITKTSTSGLVDTYTITYNDGTSGTFTVTNGAKGDKGDNAYIWIKYASQEPTEASNSFGDAPDGWLGVYFGTLDTAPTDWKQYAWYKIRGDKGDTGEPATLISSSVTYQVGDSGTIIPSGVWSESVAVVPQGKYLWTKIVHQFNTGNPVTAYTVSRMGLDGLGSVVSVANISPDANGNVPLTAADVNALPLGGGTMTGGINMNGQTLNGLNPPTEGTSAVNKDYVDAINWFGDGTSIPSGSDLDTYTTEGKYYCGSTSTSATLINSPVNNDNFVMFVFKRTHGVSINQLIITLNGALHVRGASSNGALREWRAILTDTNLNRINADIADVTKKISPKNLLDNSDFTDLITQAGILGKHGTDTYFADRWKTGGYAPTYDKTSRTITFDSSGSSMIRQKVAGSISGKTVTLAVKASNVSGNAYLSEQTAQSGHADVTIKTGVTTHTFTASDDMYVLIWSSSGASLCVDWVALYEGEYTADTLPEYRPKGCGLELLECQRYYQIRSVNNIAAIDMRPLMRLTAPTITEENGGFAYSADL